MDKIEIEIHDMSEKIYELQKKSEHLTNGQRYAAINEIEKCIAPLRNDLHHLELNMYEQGADRERIKEQINNLLNQLSELENCKSDLTARINTETEHTRQQLNDRIVNLIKEELAPLRESVAENKNEIFEVKESIHDLKIEIIEMEREREKKEAEKFDRIKWIITGCVGVLTALASLSLFLEPSIRILIHMFFG